MSDSNGVTNSGAAGSITINVTGAAPATGTYPLISYTGSLQGSGFSAYQLGTYPAGLSYALSDGAGVVELVVSDPHYLDRRAKQRVEHQCHRRFEKLDRQRQSGGLREWSGRDLR